MVDTVNEDKAIEFYKQFRVERRTALIPPFAPYPKPFSGDRFHFLSMPFNWVAADALREIANSINDFGRYIHYLHAWQPIFEGANQDDQQSLLLEHIRPFTVLCLGAPQALRGRLIYAASMTSYHANRFRVWPKGAPKWDGTNANMKVAKKVSDQWSSWPALAAALGVMGQGQFSEATSNFRNENEHGHPRAIGIGVISTVKRTTDKEGMFKMHMKQDDPDEPREVWAFGEQAPMALKDLLPLLVQEHAYALDAFNAYLALVEEQHAARPDPL